ncbi:hypothetical protein EYF80_035945 [Liparis tanakae]|uniref:Uncharacterized protein n=1 Tax=Liparis tanakae TaxID=230148 RepID=A0A4Z2GM58_9TELE|nr:hypothetical protein EYF80_035945 [Liparis tanakae]
MAAQLDLSPSAEKISARQNQKPTESKLSVTAPSEKRQRRMRSERLKGKHRRMFFFSGRETRYKFPNRELQSGAVTMWMCGGGERRRGSEPEKDAATSRHPAELEGAHLHAALKKRRVWTNSWLLLVAVTVYTEGDDGGSRTSGSGSLCEGLGRL